MLKNGNKLQRTPKPKNRKFFGIKLKNRSKKLAETTKPKIPMLPSTSIFNHYNIMRSPMMRSPLKP